jgi:hypothetical protein
MRHRTLLFVATALWASSLAWVGCSGSTVTVDNGND